MAVIEELLQDLFFFHVHLVSYFSLDTFLLSLQSKVMDDFEFLLIRICVKHQF